MCEAAVVGSAAWLESYGFYEMARRLRERINQPNKEERYGKRRITADGTNYTNTVYRKP